VAESDNVERKGQLSLGKPAYGAGHKLFGGLCVGMGCRLARTPCCLVDAHKGPLAYEELDCDGSTSV